jgi:hypothetical protein
VEDWIHHIHWANFNQTHDALKETFNDILRRWDQQHPKRLHQLLQFVTGLKTPPFPGFMALNPLFEVQIVNGTEGSMMSAHTCSNKLDISGSLRLEWMEEKLYESMHQVEFHLSK